MFLFVVPKLLPSMFHALFEFHHSELLGFKARCLFLIGLKISIFKAVFVEQ